MKDSQAKVDRLNSFLQDPNLLTMSSWEKRFNTFDIISLSETRVSAFLAWLLDPKESHGLSDLFLKELLHQIIITNESILPQEFQTAFEINTGALSQAYIYTELPASISSNNGQERIDIAIIDEVNGLCIFIENKYGAKLSPNQLEKYHDHLSKAYSDYSSIFIYLDDDASACANEDWAHLDYEWIYSFLAMALEHKLGDLRTHQFIRDFYCHNYDAYYSLDSRYQGIKSGFYKLFKEHREFVRDLKSFGTTADKRNKPITDLCHSDICHLGSGDYAFMLFTTYYKYSSTLSKLMDMSSWDEHYDRIVDHIGDEDTIDQNKNRIAFTPRLVDDRTDPEASWPIYVAIRKTQQEEETAFESSIRIDLTHPLAAKLFQNEIAKESRKNRRWAEVLKTIKDAKNKHLAVAEALKLYDLIEARISEL
jgi:hypothetical protein